MVVGTIRCHVINCKYNSNNQCNAENIEVTTDHPWPTATASVSTACETFVPEDEKVWTRGTE